MAWGTWDIKGSLAQLGLDTIQQARVLEWYATRIWEIGEETSPYGPEYCGKSYDPLSVELLSTGGVVAHSYALGFNGKPGRRHYDFDSLDELERSMTEGLIAGIKARSEEPDEWTDPVEAS